MQIANQLSAPFQLLPEELVTIALRTLHDAKIVPIEWGAALYRRMGVPMMIKVCSALYYRSFPLTQLPELLLYHPRQSPYHSLHHSVSSRSPEG